MDGMADEWQAKFLWCVRCAGDTSNSYTSTANTLPAIPIKQVIHVNDITPPQ